MTSLNERLSKQTPGFSDKAWPYDDIIQRLPMRGTLLEVGSACGLSAVTFAEKFKETGRDYTIHTVDLFKGITIYDETYTGDQQKEYLDRIVDIWPNMSYTECNFFQRDWDVPTVFFYDGDHSFDATLKALFGPMRNAEYIIVDDYTNTFPEVMEAVNLFQSKTSRHMEVLKNGVALFE